MSAANFERHVVPLNAGLPALNVAQRTFLVMKILHIAAGLSFGGIAEVVAMLTLYQKKLGCDVTMATVAAEGEELSESVKKAVSEGVGLAEFRSSFPKVLFFSWQMMTGLDALIKEADVVHVHSNWTFPVWWGCRCALKYRKKLMMTPHGCLSPERLAHSKWKKIAVGWMDRCFLKRADVIHATCEEEANAIKDFIALASGLNRPVGAGLSRGRAAGLNAATTPCAAHVQARRSRCFNVLRTFKVATQRSNVPQGGTGSNTQALPRPSVVVIPNGIDLDEFDGEIDKNFWKKRYPEVGDRKVILAFGRLHPLKGLDLLINAVANLIQDGKETDHIPDYTAITNWTLVIAGPDEQGTLAQLKSQVSKLRLEEQVFFTGAIPASERKDAIGSAHCFVLPSKHENFGLTVVEALACRVPVIATKGAPWGDLLGCASARVGSSSDQETNELINSRTNKLARTERSGWWVAVGVEPLVGVLEEAMALSDDERAQMGLNGRKLVEQKYQWSSVAEKMLEIYEQA